MLSTEAIDSVWALTDRCDANKFVIMPMPDTPLAALVVEAGASEGLNIVRPDGTYEPDVVAITTVANVVNQLQGVNCHEELKKKMGSEIGKAIQGHITMAKSVVAPAVEALALAVAEDLSNRTVSGLLGMEVITSISPDILRNANFGTMVSKYAEVPFDNPQLILNLPDQTHEELRELIKTGSATIDADVDSWLADVGDSFLAKVYQDAFQCKTEGPDSIGGPSFRGLVSDRINGRNNAMAIFLLSNRLIEEPLTGTEMNPNAYENLVSDFRSQAGAQLCRLIDSELQAEKNGQMVLNYTSNKITVIDSIYRKWMEDGGDNEVLFGNLRQQTPFLTVAEINEHAAALRSEWSSFCVITSMIEANKKYVNTKEALAENFRRLLNEAVEDQDGVEGGVESVMNKFNLLLDDVAESEMDCLYSLSLKLVCRSRFPNTDAEVILTNIETFKKQNPNVPIADVATVVYMKHIARWVASMFVVQAL